jgi:signal peptidase II
MEGKTWFLIGLPVVICALGVYYMYRQRNSSKLQLVSLAMLIAGGLGNLIDRIRLKEVIDYIKFEPFNFPVFNFADICVVVGAILFAVYIIFLDDSGKKNTETENEKTEDTVKAAEENDD